MAHSLWAYKVRESAALTLISTQLNLNPYEILGSLNVIFKGRGSIPNGQFIEGHKNANGQNEFDTKKIFQLHPERIFSPI